jgi:hypothetical protein
LSEWVNRISFLSPFLPSWTSSTTILWLKKTESGSGPFLTDRSPNSFLPSIHPLVCLSLVLCCSFPLLIPTVLILVEHLRSWCTCTRIISTCWRAKTGTREMGMSLEVVSVSDTLVDNLCSRLWDGGGQTLRTSKSTCSRSRGAIETSSSLNKEKLIQWVPSLRKQRF